MRGIDFIPRANRIDRFAGKTVYQPAPNGAVGAALSASNLVDGGPQKYATTVTGNPTIGPFNSIALDGTGDYITSPTIAINNGTTTGITVEGFILFNAFNSAAVQDYFYVGSSNAPIIYNVSGTGLFLFYNGANRVGPIVISTGIEYHIAWSRSNGTSYLFINGVLQGSAADTTDYGSIGHRFGADGANGRQTNCRLRDLRISAVGRYTQNFQPPPRMPVR